VLLGNLGWAYMMHGQGDEAERHLGEGVAVLERLGLEDSPQALQLIGTWALARQEMGDLPGSIALYDRGLAMAARAGPEEPPSIYFVANRAYALAQAGRHGEAEAAYRDGIVIAEAQDAPLIAYNIRMLVVDLWADEGRLADGERELAEADARRDGPLPADGPAAFARQLAAARLAALRGEPDAAVQAYTQAITSDIPAAGNVNALLGRAGALQQAGRLAQAQADARAALDAAERLRGRRPASFRSGLARLALARVSHGQGDAVAAARDAAEALVHLGATLDPGHPALARIACARRSADQDELTASGVVLSKARLRLQPRHGRRKGRRRRAWRRAPDALSNR
jgi:tetratricopeptide (TPR) repeat protein